MKYWHGTLLKQTHISEGHCFDLVKREDGAFQFHERIRRPDGIWEFGFQSGTYISAEAAEAAARLKFKL